MDEKKVIEKMQSVSADMQEKNEAKLNLNKNDQDINVDLLKLYFCEPYTIPCEDGNPITLYQPKIQDFIDYGESNIYGLIMPLISNSTTHRLQLWKMGIDWNKVSDYELFLQLFSGGNFECSHVIFGDLNINEFEQIVYNGGETPCLALYNFNQKVLIDEKVYKYMASYIQTMFNAKPKVEFAKGKSNKLDCIFEDEQKLKHQKQDNNESNLLNMISFCLNHPGFKYKKNELRDVGIFEFLDSMQRLNLYEGTRALVNGVYANPFLDSSKLNKEALNFMRDLKDPS